MSEQPPPPPQALAYASPFGPWFNPSIHPSMQMHPHMHPLAHYQLQHFYAAQGLPLPPFLGGPSPASSASASTPAVPSPTRSNVEPSPSATTSQLPEHLSSNPASVDTPPVEGEDPSPASFAAAASSASPVSPLGQSTSSAAGKAPSHQHDPSQAGSASSTLPPLSDPRALLQRSLQGLHQLVSTGNFDARPSRQGPGPPPKSGACAACRSAKAKCNQQEPACERCVKMKVECTYPVFNKRGRKRTRTPNQILLENCHEDLEKALLLLADRALPSIDENSLPVASTSRSQFRQFSTASNQHLSPPNCVAYRTQARSSSSNSTSPGDGTDEDDPTSRELKSVIESPLAVLAHISSLKVSESTEEESGKRFLPKRPDGDPNGKEEGTGGGTAAEGYFATGLYQLRSDADPAYDPINLGIITLPELERIIDFYFSSLRPFSFHLEPNLHTPRFLRDVSPFLTTTLAYIAATYLPDLVDRIDRLREHMLRLSDRVWSEGLKSLEIVQAYALLIHWVPIESDWGDDRRWGWLGQAVRIATEIKLNKTINSLTYEFYRSVTPLGPTASEALNTSRAWTWKLLFVAEIALCGSTGRLAAIHTLSISTPGPELPAQPAPDDPNYNVAALVTLNRIYIKAIAHANTLQGTEDGHESKHRTGYEDAWRTDLRAWAAEWPDINPFVRLIAQHNTTILTSISLRFKGPVMPVLEECRRSAFETAKMAVNWPDDTLRWTTNLVVVNIAYAATLLLRIAGAKPEPIDPETKFLCAIVAELLVRVGETRPAVRTLGTLHGTRVRMLLQAEVPKASGAATPAMAVDPAAALASIVTTPSALPAFGMLHPYAPGMQVPSAVQQLQNVDFAAGMQGPPSLFNLPTPDSHALWDLFNESAAAAAGPAVPDGMRSGLQSPQSGAVAPGAAHGDGAAGGGASSVTPMTGTEQTWTGPGARPDEWMYKSLDQDWLSSEPGAWAW
ncbi:hypothetical protein JCM10908_002033 [Rhodotorula pacifica]|uniref:uncharacterized protein n=1 Tax=Rhodotorula pacifica TaxID=1495444 RepID=UPI0031724761